jgi:superfamily II DNA/RNA helicase
MPPPIQKLADKFLNDPKRVEVARPATAKIYIEQRLVEVRPDKKKDAVRDILRQEGVRNAIIFSNRKTTVRELAAALKRSRFAVGQIHGDMEQAERIAELERFKSEEINILVASDVAARGLDIKGVSHVFNFDVPWQPDDYIHRIGRTGRAGKTGTAITLATNADADQVAAIERLMGFAIPPLATGDAPAEAESPRDEPKEESKRPGGRGRSRGKPREAAKAETRPARSEPRPARAEPKSAAPEPRRHKTDAKPARAARPPEPVDADDGDWNGPVPGFLGQGFGS